MVEFLFMKWFEANSLELFGLSYFALSAFYDARPLLSNSLKWWMKEEFCFNRDGFVMILICYLDPGATYYWVPCMLLRSRLGLDLYIFWAVLPPTWLWSIIFSSSIPKSSSILMPAFFLYVFGSRVKKFYLKKGLLDWGLAGLSLDPSFMFLCWSRRVYTIKLPWLSTGVVGSSLSISCLTTSIFSLLSALRSPSSVRPEFSWRISTVFTRIGEVSLLMRVPSVFIFYYSTKDPF